LTSARQQRPRENGAKVLLRGRGIQRDAIVKKSKGSRDILHCPAIIIVGVCYLLEEG